MDVLDKARMLTYHRRRLGQAPLKELGWRDAFSQASRFAALCRWGDLSDKIVLDLGCGHGDLKPYFDARFAGVDEVRRRHGHLPDSIACR